MFADQNFGVWQDGAYEPRSPFTSAGRDKNGECLGNYDRKKFCLRDERHASASGGPADMGTIESNMARVANLASEINDFMHSEHILQASCLTPLSLMNSS